MAGGVTVRASDLRSSGHGFDSRSGRYQAILVNSAFHPSGVGKSSTGLVGWGYGGVHSLVSGWQVSGNTVRSLMATDVLQLWGGFPWRAILGFNLLIFLISCGAELYLFCISGFTGLSHLAANRKTYLFIVMLCSSTVEWRDSVVFNTRVNLHFGLLYANCCMHIFCILRQTSVIILFVDTSCSTVELIVMWCNTQIYMQQNFIDSINILVPCHVDFVCASFL